MVERKRIMDFLELFVDFAEGGIHILFLCLGLPQKEKKLSWWIRNILCLLLHTISQYWILDRYDFTYVEGVLIVTRLLLISMFLCNGGFFQKLTFCILGNLIINISGLLTATFMPLILDTSIVGTLQQNGSMVRIISLIFAKSCQLAISLIIVMLVHRIVDETENIVWIPLSFLLAFSSVTTDLVTAYYLIESENSRNVVFVIAMLLAIVESMVVFWIFMIILRNDRENNRLSAFIEQIDREVDSVNENEKKLEEIKGLKHEIRNEYILVRELINNGKQTQAVEKLSDIINDAEDNFVRIISFDSGSESVNAVLNYFIRNLQNIGTDVKYSIENLKLIKENEKIICSILLNLLKNAYETEMKQSDKAVEIEIKNEKGYIKIAIKNKIEESVLSKNSELKTTKTDNKNHGFGIKSVKKMVKLKEGSVNISEYDGWFSVEILL